MSRPEVVVFWYRRDLRLEDNVALFHALESAYPVIPLFIFDDAILESLPENDARVGFIHESLSSINATLNKVGSALLVKKGSTRAVWQSLMAEYAIQGVFYNKDYEPYAIQRDRLITNLLQEQQIEVKGFKDQVIFEELEITKADGLPYTVYTPYKNKWLELVKIYANKI